MSFADFEREYWRLAILETLAQAQAYTVNQEILLAKLREQGHALNRDQLKVELAWLDQTAGCIVDQVVGGVHIATLTADGGEVVEGTRAIPGIRRRGPAA